MSKVKAEYVTPTWYILKFVFEKPRTIFVASPWISKEGVEFLDRLLASYDSVPSEIWTRFDVLDAISGFSDYRALLELIESHGPRRVKLRAAENLHMKVFWDGGERTLVGSCNLTGGGFANNIEAAVLLKGNSPSITAILNEQRSKLSVVTLRELRLFVESLDDTVAIREKWTKLESDLSRLKYKRLRKERRAPPYYGLR